MYIYPPLSVVIRLQPKGGLSACVRFDQKCGTKNPDLLSQIRILVKTDIELDTGSRQPEFTFSQTDILAEHRNGFLAVGHCF